MKSSGSEDEFERGLDEIAHADSLTKKIRTLEVLRANLYLDLKAKDGKPGLDLGPVNFRVAQLLVKVIAAEADLEKQRRKFFAFRKEPAALKELWDILAQVPELKLLVADPLVQGKVLALLRERVAEEPDYEA